MDVSDRLQVDTPEQVALEFDIAGIGSRFLAITVDTLLQLLLYAALALALFFLGDALAGLLRAGANSWWRPLIPAMAVLALFTVHWGYFAGFEIVWRGQTPGKRAANIRVIKDSGRPLDAFAAIVRNLMRAVDVLPALYGVGLVCMMANRQSRRLGDFVAGTIVVHERAPVPLEPAWTPGMPATAAFPPAPEAAKLTVDELALIETFLRRRIELTDPVEEETARAIVQRVTARTGLAPAPGQSLAGFLATVATQARDARAGQRR